MRAAAICYRMTDTGLTFLLVRTSKGDRWTFPKGHAEKGESLDVAAAREAREEAGVEGQIDPSILTRYRYPSGRKSSGDHEVGAYLLRVDRQLASMEPGRLPQWFSPEIAVHRLAELRTRWHAQEHARVIQTALDRLNGQGIWT